MLGNILLLVFGAVFLVVFAIGYFKVASQPDEYGPAKDHLKEAKKTVMWTKIVGDKAYNVLMYWDLSPLLWNGIP